MSYRLINGVERNAQHPATFEIPPAAEREDLYPGQFAKVGFVPSNSAFGTTERMLVEVKVVRRSPKGVLYYGVLDNDPVCFEPEVLSCGASVAFGPEHVLSILNPKEA